MKLPFSPQTTTIYVHQLLDKLNAKFDPELVSISPEPYSKESNCFINVEEKIKKDGGNACYGWAVLQTSIICEAERHAVWESPEGELVDITPRAYGIKKILFIPDEDFVYVGQLEDNVRINITNNPVVDDFIQICEAYEKVCATGKRLNDDQIELTPTATGLYQELVTLKQNTYYFITKMNGKPNRNCYCDSGKSYSKCHGNNLSEILIQGLQAIGL